MPRGVAPGFVIAILVIAMGFQLPVAVLLAPMLRADVSTAVVAAFLNTPHTAIPLLLIARWGGHGVLGGTGRRMARHRACSPAFGTGSRPQCCGGVPAGAGGDGDEAVSAPGLSLGTPDGGRPPGAAGRFAPVAGAALLSGLLMLWASGTAVFAAAFVAGALMLGAAAWMWSRARPEVVREATVDWLLGHALLEQSDHPVAVTDRAGRLVCANNAYRTVFDGDHPPAAWWSANGSATEPLVALARTAWQDGRATARLDGPAGRIDAVVQRAGASDDLLVWRLSPVIDRDLPREIGDALAGDLGDRLGRAGGMAVLVSDDGRMEAATRAWGLRATGDLVTSIEGRLVADVLSTEANGVIHFQQEGSSGSPLRLLHVPLEDLGRSLLLAFDEAQAQGSALPVGGDLDAVNRLLDRVPLRLALVGRDGRLLGGNEAFRQFIGPDASALYPGDLVVPDDKGALADHIRRMSGGRGLSGDITVRFVSAPDEPVALTASFVRGVGSAAVLLALRDEASIQPAKAEVAQLNKMEAVGHLAGGVAHDFNNLLTAIIGICDLLLMRHVPGDPDFDDVQQIRSNSNRAASLTRHLLAFSRQQTLRPQVVQLPDLLGEVTHLLKRLLGEQIVLAVDHARQQGAVRVDAQQLEQVVVNLAVNARDVMAGGGTLTIETYPVTAQEVRAMRDGVLPIGDYTALRMTDTGPGIPAAVLPKIFDPFFTTKEAGKGTGLGLSTSYGIVRQSGGFIAVDKAPGAGARFTIYLPVHEGPAEVREEIKARPTGEWGQGHLLLVEDEDMVRSVAERALSRAGYSVRSAASGEEALALLEEDSTVDLVVSDVAMPGLDGPQTVRAIREHLPAVPVLFMSGYAEEQARRRIDVDGADFLPKPFSVMQLTDAVAQLLARARA